MDFGSSQPSQFSVRCLSQKPTSSWQCFLRIVSAKKSCLSSVREDRRVSKSEFDLTLCNKISNLPGLRTAQAKFIHLNYFISSFQYPFPRVRHGTLIMWPIPRKQFSKHKQYPTRISIHGRPNFNLLLYSISLLVLHLFWLLV